MYTLIIYHIYTFVVVLPAHCGQILMNTLRELRHKQFIIKAYMGHIEKYYITQNTYASHGGINFIPGHRS